MPASPAQPPARSEGVIAAHLQPPLTLPLILVIICSSSIARCRITAAAEPCSRRCCCCRVAAAAAEATHGTLVCKFSISIFILRLDWLLLLLVQLVF